VLERAGFTVVTAEDGVEAVQGVFRTQPDAVILDVQMPRLSGYVAARLLKDDWQTAEIPVVLLTSLDAASDRYWGKQTGADRFLTKDFEAPELVSAIAEVIQAADAARGGRPAAAPGPGRGRRRRGDGAVSELLGPQAVRGLGVVRGHPDRRGRARLRGVGGRRPRRPRPDRRLRPGRRSACWTTG
jgi:CheY-like chemotaxis protein